MTQKNPPGYPLPSGELGSDDIICQLVYFPDRPEYWQAFLGAYHYLTTWRAWERDADKRGKDAAANWREAFEMTMECWRMACLEQLQQDVSDILLALQNGICCHEIDPTDGDQYTDDVEDGIGDVPQNIIDAGYAEDAADWDGFDDYKCMVAHVVIDSMEAKFRKMAPYIDESAIVVGGIASLAIIISAVWTGGLSLLLAGLISSIGGVALFYEAVLSGSAMITLANKIATNHDELACAFYYTDGLEGSVAAVKDKIAELFNVAEEVLLDNSGIDIDAKALYAGRYNQVDTAAILEAEGYDVLDFTCDCFPGLSGTILWNDVDDDLMWSGSLALMESGINLGGRTVLKYTTGSNGTVHAYMAADGPIDYFSWAIVPLYKLRFIHFKFYLHEINTMTNWSFALAYHTAESGYVELWAINSDSYAKNQWFDVEIDSIPDYCQATTVVLRISQARPGQNNTGRNILFDDFYMGVEKDDCGDY